MDLRIMIEPQQGATYEEQLAMARATEAAGLGGFFRSDHYLSMGGGSDRPLVGPTDARVTLAGLARETERVRLGTMLSAATFRPPGQLAIMAAEVDQMSGGRLELGLGAGWFAEEHRAYGLPFPDSLTERLDRLEEQLEVVTGLWGTPVGERYRLAGRYWQLEDSPALPKPSQAHVPVIVGGQGTRRTPAIAARFADECNVPFATPEASRAVFGSLERALESLGRAPGSVVRSVAVACVLGTTEAEARRRAAAIGEDLDELRRRGAAGLPEEAAERLAAYGAAGAGRAYLQLMDPLDLEQVHLAGEVLAPLVADR